MSGPVQASIYSPSRKPSTSRPEWHVSEILHQSMKNDSKTLITIFRQQNFHCYCLSASVWNPPKYVPRNFRKRKQLAQLPSNVIENSSTAYAGVYFASKLEKSIKLQIFTQHNLTKRSINISEFEKEYSPSQILCPTLKIRADLLDVLLYTFL